MPAASYYGSAVQQQLASMTPDYEQFSTSITSAIYVSSYQ